MSIGNTNTNGQKKSNCNWQKRILQAATQCCTGSSGSGARILNQSLKKDK